MKPTSLCLVFLALASGAATAPAATLRWAGTRLPVKVSAGDGVTQLGEKIGTFIALPGTEPALNVVRNVRGNFPGTRAWVTLGVGEVPDAPTATDEEQEALLGRMDEEGVDVYLELWPRKTTDVVAAIDTWLRKYQAHRCVKGLGIDLEFYKNTGATDEEARAWDERIKSHGARYRMFLKHWDERHMPRTYRGRGDIIFIDTSSEATVDALVDEQVKWAAHFAPSAVAFQIGYPADEDGMDGSRDKGWFVLADPINFWGSAILEKIAHRTQEVGLLWVCVKSGKSYNRNWDLTKR